VAGTLPYGADLHDPLFSEDPEAVDAALEIKACLATSETSKALMTCDRMRALHPDNKLFEGLKLEIENKERESRLEFVRRLSSDLENEPDLDSRINTIQQALNRYPAESQLLELLRNAAARRDLFHALVAEARHEELSDRFADSLKRWSLLRELYPLMPGLETEVQRVEALVDSHRRMKRRAEFVDSIFGLSSTGDYARAVYQCINALAEYPNDAGLLALKASIEEKAEHATEIQRFVSEGVTFLHAHEIEAALESFTKARTLDQNNLQVRYLMGIALLEKASDMMSNDRRKLALLLDEARNFIPNPAALPEMAPGLRPADESWEKSLVSIQPSVVDAPLDAQPDSPPAPVLPTAVEQSPEPETGAPADPVVNPSPGPPDPEMMSPRPIFSSFRTVALFIFILLGAVIIGWAVYANQPSSNASLPAPALPQPAPSDVKAGETQTASFDLGTAPALLDVYFVTDQHEGTVWIDDQFQGELLDGGLTLTGIEPGLRLLRMSTPAGEIDMSFEFSPGMMPIPKTLPSRAIANILFVGSADEKTRVECNCVPAGLRVGQLAERIPSAGLEVPLLEGEHRAELWVGKTRRDLTIHGGRLPVVTIAVFSASSIAESISKVEK
jgi:tetratricopeptide (TPR) repeat protein